jgi:hypothetical protein
MHGPLKVKKKKKENNILSYLKYNIWGNMDLD